MKSHQIVCLLLTHFYFSSNIQPTFGNKSKIITGNKNRLNNRNPLTFFYSKPLTNIRKNGTGFKRKIKRRLPSKKPKNGILGRRHLNLFHNFDLKKYRDKNFSPDFLNKENFYDTHAKLNKDFTREASNELYNGSIENSDEASTEEYNESLIKNLDEILSKGSEKKLRKKSRESNEESYRNSDEARKESDEFDNNSKKLMDRKFSKRSNNAIFKKLDKLKRLDNPKITSEVQRRCLLLGAMMLLNYYDDDEEEEYPKRKRPKPSEPPSTTEPMDEQALSDQPITEAPSLSEPVAESDQPITENPTEQDSIPSKRKRHKNSEEFYDEVDDDLISMFNEYD